ncbi:hypothetical protein BDV97DRAFT_381398 [Delphinella strobiligena]|nr:hypothetical protein BDV97DRAFT_381398 [Delphinella strobiligena]
MADEIEEKQGVVNTLSTVASVKKASTRSNGIKSTNWQSWAISKRNAGDPLRLALDIDSATFKEFCQRAAEVRDESEELNHESYLDPSKVHDMYHIHEEDYFISSVLCNKFEIPVWPLSIGRNVGCGGAALRVAGSVALDLGKHMNQSDIDVDEGFGLVEPGNNLRDKLRVDVPDLGGDSNIGNTIGRGVDGSLVRTGMGALPNPKADTSKPPHEQEAGESWQLFNYGFGAYNDDIFSQSSLGIVVKMGIWLMCNPGGYQSSLITFPKYDQLHQILEIIRPLRVGIVLQNVPTLRHILLDAGVHGAKKKYFDTDKPLTDEPMDEIAKKLGLDRWNFNGNLTTTELKWVDWLSNGAHVFFSPISKVSADDDVAQYKMSRERCQEYGFDFIGTFCVGMIEMHHIFCLVFDRKDAESCRRARKLLSVLIDDAAKQGWGECRTHLTFLDQITATYNWNDNVQIKLNEKIKVALNSRR